MHSDNSGIEQPQNKINKYNQKNIISYIPFRSKKIGKTTEIIRLLHVIGTHRLENRKRKN